MRRIILAIAVILLTSTSVFSQLEFGLGATVATESGIKDAINDQKANYGINFRAKLDFPILFGVQAGFSYYLPTTGIDGAEQNTVTNMQANVDLIYYFIKIANTKVYALGGFNYSYYRIKEKGILSSNSVDNEFKQGFELGAGVVFGKIFLEAKYDFSKINYEYLGTDYEARGSQIVGTFGIYF